MKRLVTEADLRRLARGSRLVVDRDTLVTPAARDYALWAGIELAPAAGGAAPSKACDCSGCATSGGANCCGEVALPRLGEGDWLVAVRGGSVTVRRISP